MLSGRVLSALSPSTHVFSPLIVNGSYVFTNATVVFVAIVPLTVRSDPFLPVAPPADGVYPTTPVSVTVNVVPERMMFGIFTYCPFFSVNVTVKLFVSELAPPVSS